MLRYVWRITQEMDSAKQAELNARLFDKIKLERGPELVFGNRAAALKAEFPTAWPGPVGDPTQYFQAWVEETAAITKAISWRMAKEPVIGGTVIMPANLLITENVGFWEQLKDFFGGTFKNDSTPALPLISAKKTEAGFTAYTPLSWGALSSTFPQSSEAYCHQQDPHKVARQLFVSRQRYLFGVANGVLGLGAIDAWTYEGGFGDGIQVADVEEGWLEHESLVKGPAIRPGLDSHGTKVLSLIGGRPVIENGQPYGILGMAPATQLLCVSVRDKSGYFDPVEGMMLALDKLSAGDVLLVEINSRLNINEVGMPQDSTAEYPIETFGDGWLASWVGVQRGVYVVHAACNWGLELKSKDTKSIMVGAASPKGYDPGFPVNWGERVNLHAWGRCAASAGSHSDSDSYKLHKNKDSRLSYTFFDGTSAAAALVAGAVASISGILKANSVTASPELLRKCLCVGGTAPPVGGVDEAKIGRMLNIPGALAELERELGISFKRNGLEKLDPSARAREVAMRKWPSPK